MSACILVPGSALQNNAEIIVPLNPHLYKASITLAMQTLADTDPDACLRPVLIAICRLAEYLDEHGSAIDYRRRRGIAAKLTLTWSRWRDLACGAGAHPGDHVPTGRFLHAQRHLHRLLTDSDLTDPAHPLAINSAAERTRYLQFTASLTPVLRRAFHREADQFLAEHGIDEPSTWHPPLTLAEGLELPGVNLDDKALRTVKRIVIDEGQALRNAAKALGIHTEHVRLALEQLDRPERTWTRGGPEAWQRDRELARILTREYFQREYVGARRTLREIAQSVGTTRRIVTEHARRHGISLDQVPRKTTAIDEAWLREQYSRHHRSTSDIAGELGASQTAVNRAVARIGVPLRPSGIASHPHKIGHAAEHCRRQRRTGLVALVCAGPDATARITATRDGSGVGARGPHICRPFRPVRPARRWRRNLAAVEFGGVRLLELLPPGIQVGLAHWERLMRCRFLAVRDAGELDVLVHGQVDHTA